MIRSSIHIIISNYLKASFSTLCDASADSEGTRQKKDISMRRLLSLAAFGFGFYYLWYNTDPTTEMLGIGAMGFALLLEFIGAD